MTERRDSDSLRAGAPTVTITLEPWPHYGHTGNGPAWKVLIASPKFTGALIYSKRLRRFTDSNDTMRCRRGSPKVYAAALAHVERSVLTQAERLATDPRFAGWLGLLADDDPRPDSAAEESIELTRRAKVSFLAWAEGNPEVPADQIAEARAFLAAHPPLKRPLGTGEPT